MSPRLVKWDSLYQKQGLTIIDVNNGERDTKEALTAYIKKKKKKYATLWDQGGQVCEQYGIRGYPAAFLIGADGKVVWEGFPVPELKTVEKLIQRELKKVKLPKPKKEAPVPVEKSE